MKRHRDGIGLLEHRFEHAPLPAHSVVVVGGVPRSGIRQGEVPVHVVLTHRDVDHFGAAVLVGIVGVVDALRHVDRDASQRVHHVDESVQVDERVVVNGDPEQLLERRHDQRCARVRCVRIQLGVLLPVLVDRVADVGEAVAVVDVEFRWKRHVPEVARNLQHRRVPRFGIDTDHDHGVGPDAGPPRACIAPHQQDVQPFIARPQRECRRGRRCRGGRSRRRSGALGR